MSYDWIVVGAGLVGSAVAYELAKVGFSVLLLDQSPDPSNATRYSYGGIAFWAGDSDLTRQLCQESEAIHPQLSEELGYDTQFREMDMLLVIDRDRDPTAIAASYQHYRIQPQLLDPSMAVKMEPLLEPKAIAAALHIRHGHVDPESLTRAYQHGLRQAGGRVEIASVERFVQTGERIEGVVTSQEIYSGQVIVSAGGLSRRLLYQMGISTRLYYTQAEILETPPLETVSLQTIVMSAELQRMPMEAKATRPEYESLWDEPGHEPVPPILDVGAIQFQDGRIRIGQLSRVLTDPDALVNASASEEQLRDRIGQVLPCLKSVPAAWGSCLVGFSGDRLPLIGALPGVSGLYLCSGFNGPFLLAPPLARRFAKSQKGEADPILAQLSPARFS
ncbi:MULTISPECIES: FAD-binding oxidoreductase [unclassified Leptolyngbya]|uniref:NAD(P)/FAD-dependent oxidoreductase n=1 Tax=unclassified Leptolyngbya TaxID=2650499 RepID=UPI001683BC26|nr:MULTISPECIES: FAD-binding oxidoreductase [unclassified Leptolyngbya]MBD1910863.1 FAD-binding oxidoreductase [Leptolyngbya sp. FACHB-8]MBD2153742.1 FAD-binding oxidoreductase [Leptolyngbya sp. FACHB-16]